MPKKNYLKITMQTMTIIMTIFFIGIILWYLSNITASNDKMFALMKQLGAFGPFTFILLQIIQVVFPVIPGGASCLVGVLLFGPMEGFIYNYIGLCIGSIIAFLISRKYGMSLVQKLFKQETIDKYLGSLQTQKFRKIFFWGILLPGAPDDLLCYLAGLTKITLSDFTKIIIIGKPLTLLFYSIGIAYLPSFFFKQ